MPQKSSQFQHSRYDEAPTSAPPLGEAFDAQRSSAPNAELLRQLNAPLGELLLTLQEIEYESDRHCERAATPNPFRDSLRRAFRETAQMRDIVARIASGNATRGSAPGQLNSLTARELQVLALVSGGLSNKEGAHRLQISCRTYESHRAHVMRKLGARNTAELVRISLTGLS